MMPSGTDFFLSDEQLEQGIEELEQKYKGQDVLKFNMAYRGIIVTKKPQ